MRGSAVVSSARASYQVFKSLMSIVTKASTDFQREYEQTRSYASKTKETDHVPHIKELACSEWRSMHILTIRKSLFCCGTEFWCISILFGAVL